MLLHPFRRLAVALLALTMATPLFAQNNEVEKTIYVGGEGSLHLGYQYLDMAPFNQFLPAGLADLSANGMTVGGGGHAFMGRFIIGGNGQAVFTPAVSNDSMEARLAGGFGFFNLGYAVVMRDHVRFWPYLGIGGGGTSVNITQLGDLPARDVVADPQRGVNIGSGAFMMELGLGLSLHPALHQEEDEEGQGGFIIGLRVGGMVAFPNNDWSYDGGRVRGADETYRFTGAYARLTLGFGGYAKMTPAEYRAHKAD